VVATARRAVGRPARIGAAPTRFAALAAASRARARRAEVVERKAVRRVLAPLPVDLLATFAEGRGTHADAALSALPEP
jgi:protein ImuB